MQPDRHLRRFSRGVTRLVNVCNSRTIRAYLPELYYVRVPRLQALCGTLIRSTWAAAEGLKVRVWRGERDNSPAARSPTRIHLLR